MLKQLSKFGAFSGSGANYMWSYTAAQQKERSLDIATRRHLYETLLFSKLIIPEDKLSTESFDINLCTCLRNLLEYAKLENKLSGQIR